MPFTGYHRLEKDLWVDGLQADSPAIADQLLTDVTELVEKTKAVELNPLQLANGAKALLDEMATSKITGEEETYSHTDLWDLDANFEGAEAAIDALRPYLTAKNPALMATIDQRAAAFDEVIDTHKKGDGFVLYPELSPADLKALTAALDAFSEPVATLAGEVAGT
jgi:iron uptake system component EfeO